MSLLSVENVSKNFGGLQAVKKVSFDVEEGDITGIIGPNGAGKTTLLNLISGADKPSEGRISFDGERLVGLPPYEIAKKGIARTFQLVRLFNELNLLDNVMVGRHMLIREQTVQILFGFRSIRQEEQQNRERCLEILKLLNLEDRMDDVPGSLPAAQQRLLQLGRALASEPKLLLLDEVAAGLTVSEKQELTEVLQSIHNRGVTILLVEHDMRFVMNICQKIVVLNFGQKIAEGSPVTVTKNPVVIEAYLGRESEIAAS
jgi:branched-chain amino acid transport system ATP-binding protein